MFFLSHDNDLNRKKIYDKSLKWFKESVYNFYGYSVWMGVSPHKVLENKNKTVQCNRVILLIFQKKLTFDMIQFLFR